MFSNFAWSEMLVIACVAIIVVGPKDLPAMLRTFGKTLGSIKRLAGDFQRQFNDAIKESELDELKDLTSSKGFEPLQDAKKSMEEMARNIQDPTKSVMPPNSGSSAKSETVEAAKKAPVQKAAAKKPAARKTTAKTNSATKATTKSKPATSKTASTKATTGGKPATKRAAPKKAAASKAKTSKATSAS